MSHACLAQGSARSLAVLATLLVATTVHAADPPAMNDILARQVMRFLTPRVVGGRISLTTSDPTRSTNSSAKVDGREERLVISFDNSLVSLNYDQTSPQQQITLEVVDGGQVTVRRIPKSDATVQAIEFTQPAEGRLVLKVGSGTAMRVVEAPSLWHLLLGEPKLCNAELIPLLQLLRPGWRLSDAATAIETALKRTATNLEPYDRRTLSQLIRDLGSNHFATREAAQRKLAEAGQAILPFLHGVDRRRLDAEQAFRLQTVTRALSGDGAEDAADRVATSLAGDPQIWYALLGRPDEATRRVAANELKRLLQEPIGFDPSADEATRQEQLKPLAAQIDRAWKF